MQMSSTFLQIGILYTKICVIWKILIIIDNKTRFRARKSIFMIVLTTTLGLPLLGRPPTVTANAVPPPSEREAFSGIFSTN
jgi:hypothetical protein